MASMRGKVKWFSNTKGYGFIEQSDGSDAFVHYSDILGDEAYKTLEEGDQVEYELQEGQKGAKAVNVSRVAGESSEEVIEEAADNVTGGVGELSEEVIDEATEEGPQLSM